MRSDMRGSLPRATLRMVMELSDDALRSIVAHLAHLRAEYGEVARQPRSGRAERRVLPGRVRARARGDRSPDAAHDDVRAARDRPRRAGRVRRARGTREAAAVVAAAARAVRATSAEESSTKGGAVETRGRLRGRARLGGRRGAEAPHRVARALDGPPRAVRGRRGGRPARRGRALRAHRGRVRPRRDPAERRVPSTRRAAEACAATRARSSASQELALACALFVRVTDRKPGDGASPSRGHAARGLRRRARLGRRSAEARTRAHEGSGVARGRHLPARGEEGPLVAPPHAQARRRHARRASGLRQAEGALGGGAPSPRGDEGAGRRGALGE